MERAFVLGSDRGHLQEWGYVALSRASEETRLYVTGAQVERENHFQHLDEREPLTRLAQALEQPGTERLASDSRPPARAEPKSRPVIVRRPAAERELESARAHLRSLTTRLERTRELREQAEQRIAQVEAQRTSVGWHGRRRYRNELDRELRFQRSALRSLEQGLAELEPQQRRALTRLELAAQQAPDPEPARERKPRERQQSLDLGW